MANPETSASKKDTETDIQSTGLSGWLSNLFNEYRTNRETQIEGKWTRNYNAYRRNDNGLFGDNGDEHEMFTGRSTRNEDDREAGEEWRSDAYVGITRQKINTASSMILDLLLQRGKFPFRLDQAPMQDAIDLETGATEDEISARTRDIVEMQNVIEQQLRETNAYNSLKKNVLSGAIYGETYAKRRVIEVMRATFGTDENGTFVEGKESSTSPSWEHVSTWDIYRDIEVDDIQEGQGIIHRTLLSAYDLHELKKSEDPHKIDSSIDYVIKNGISKDVPSNLTEGSESPGRRTVVKTSQKLVGLEYWCRAPLKLVEDFEKAIKSGGKLKSDFNIDNLREDGNEVEIMAFMVGDHIIRFGRVEKDMTRPFYRCEWETSIDSPFGTSVADNVEATQSMVNRGVRKFDDNKELSANVMFAVKERLLDSKDMKFRPGQKFSVREEASSVDEAIKQFIVQDVGVTLLDYIALGRNLADEDSMIPKIQQGFTESGTQTAFETNQLIEKATRYIAMVIKNFDEYLILPIISDFLEANKNDEDLTVGIGDYIAVPTAYDSFQAKSIKAASMQQLLATTSQDEALANEFRRPMIARDLALLLDMDAERYIKTEEEKQQEAEAQANSPQFQMEQARIQLELEKVKAEILQIQAETAKAEAEADATADMTTIEILMKQMEVIQTQLENIQLQQEIDQDAGGNDGESKRDNGK